MTINQLLREVFALGFDDEAECSDGFLFCANRAQRQIYSELACEKSATLIVTAPTVTHYTPLYRHNPGEKMSFHFTGYSLSFRYSGDGEYTYEDEYGTRGVGFRGEGTVRMVFEKECTLRFAGEFTYQIVDLAAFSSNFGYLDKDIPIYSPYTALDLSEKIPDFSVMTRPPEDKDGIPIAGAYSTGDTLYIPTKYSGKVKITYKPSPAKITDEDMAAEIDIPKSLEHLLPILTASYLWLDDDAEKAEYYAAIYRSEANRITLTSRKSIDTSYNDVTGWA